MRKTITALLIAATLPSLALAAAPDHHTKAIHGLEASHRGGMDFSREQRQAIGRLMAEEGKARHEIHQRYLGKLPTKERDTMEKELKANQEKHQQLVRAQLTPEQVKRFEEMGKKKLERQAEWAEFQDWKASRKH